MKVKVREKVCQEMGMNQNERGNILLKDFMGASVWYGPSALAYVCKAF